MDISLPHNPSKQNKTKKHGDKASKEASFCSLSVCRVKQHVCVCVHAHTHVRVHDTGEKHFIIKGYLFLG